MPFGISASGETLYLSRADGTICDRVKLPKLPLGVSFGRAPGQDGLFCFAQPSPGTANAEGCDRVADSPESLTADGVYEDVDSVTVTLSGEGTIRYTLDGSLPTEEDEAYAGPITVGETSVLRARCFAPDALPSETLSLSFFLNEGHTLPVLSLLCEPEEMFGGYGIYTNPMRDAEIPCTVALYEQDGGFRIDCGVKMHGGTSRFHMKKKTFKLNFQDRYGGELDYDLFHNGMTVFSSLLLRSSLETLGTENWPSTYLRDALMHQLVIRYFPELSAQDSHYTVLYINGEYRGIYNLREAHSVEHYARHYGYDPEQIRHWQYQWDNDIPLRYDLVDSGLQDDECFAQVAEHVDLDSVIDWFIVQAYSGNNDYNSPNMRFYWTEEDQLLHYALVDLDMSMFSYNSFPALFFSSYRYPHLGQALMQNAAFRETFCLRLREAVQGSLSEKNVLALIDEYADLLRPEIARDRAMWGGSPEEWEGRVQALRDFVQEGDGRAMEIIESLIYAANLSREEAERYFGDLEGAAG